MAVAVAVAAVCVIPGLLFTAPSRSAFAAQGPSTKKTVPERKGWDYVKRADQRREQRRDGLKLYSFDSYSYKITTDVDKDLANDIAAHMDEVFKEYANRFGRAGFKPNPWAAVKQGERMPLYVLRRQKDYIDFLNGFGVNAKNTGGVFFRTPERESGLATWVEGQGRLQMYSVLQHEGFHQFADSRIALGLPPWVNEGIADYFGEGVVVDGKLRVGMLDRERLERVRRAVKAGETLPFATLMTMDNDAWIKRVAAGDKSSALMYDQAWSVCYFLIHGDKGKPKETKVRGTMVGALDAYLLILNDEFVKNPKRFDKAAAFKEVFSDNLKRFRKEWEDGLKELEPDPWLSSLRHVQILASAFKQLQAKGVKIESIAQVEDRLRKDLFHDFPPQATAELVPSGDDATKPPPPGVLVSGAAKNMPNIRLSWAANGAEDLEEEISFEPAKRKKPAGPPPPTVTAHRPPDKRATTSSDDKK
jgi:hypothetical protein